MCYTTRMSTTHNNEETPRPEPKPATGWRENRWEIAGYGDAPEGNETPEWIYDEEPGEMPYATGYEADEEYEQYWDQHSEG